ncbi:MAG: hypothetical protein IPP74_11410 [Alphaproteobacteria bacterium]|nr:hypothetical protein [Alphaproteobacteria bacterium]
MCFSPEISFASSIFLTGIGVLALKKATTKDELPLAMMPLLFAAQQFIEGLLWLVLLYGGSRTQHVWLTHIYVVFAGMIWPIWPAFSLWNIETETKRKHIMAAFILMGGCFALYTLKSSIEFNITSSVSSHSVLYDSPLTVGNEVLIAYLICTCMCFFVSSQRNIQWIGVANLLSFAIAFHFYYKNLVSVWCLFAATISGLIYVYFRLTKTGKTTVHA